MKTTSFDAEKMYTYLRGFATGREMKQTLAALSFARKIPNCQRGGCD